MNAALFRAVYFVWQGEKKTLFVLLIIVAALKVQLHSGCKLCVIILNQSFRLSKHVCHAQENMNFVTEFWKANRMNVDTFKALVQGVCIWVLSDQV